MESTENKTDFFYVVIHKRDASIVYRFKTIDAMMSCIKKAHEEGYNPALLNADEDVVQIAYAQVEIRRQSWNNGVMLKA